MHQIINFSLINSSLSTDEEMMSMRFLLKIEENKIYIDIYMEIILSGKMRLLLIN
jgi:hypothetical protein